MMFRIFSVLSVLLLDVGHASIADSPYAINGNFCKSQLHTCGCTTLPLSQELEEFHDLFREAANLDFNDEISSDEWTKVAKSCGFGNCVEKCGTDACVIAKPNISTEMSRLRGRMNNSMMITVCMSAGLSDVEYAVRQFRLLAEVNAVVDRKQCYKEMDECGCDMMDYVRVDTKIKPDENRTVHINFDEQEDVDYTFRTCAHTNCQKNCNTKNCDGLKESSTKFRNTFQHIFTDSADTSKGIKLNEICDRSVLDTVHDDTVEFGKFTGHRWTLPIRPKCEAELNECACKLDQFERLAELTNKDQYVDGSSAMRMCLQVNCIGGCNTSNDCNSVRLTSNKTLLSLKGRNDKLGKSIFELCKKTDASTIDERIQTVKKIERGCDDQLRECGGCSVQRYNKFIEKRAHSREPQKNKERARILYQYCAFANCIAGCKNDCGYNNMTYAAAVEKIKSIEKEPTRVIEKCAAATMESAFSIAADKMKQYLVIVVLSCIFRTKLYFQN